MDVQTSSRPQVESPGARGPRAAWTRRSNFDVLLVVVVAGLAVTRLETSAQYLATTIVIYSLFALSVNVLVGWHGTPSFGQAAYFGGGAYFVAMWREIDLNPLLLLLMAGLFGGVLALVFGVASARTHGITFAMLTLVFGQVLYQLVFTIDALHGDNGIPDVPAGQLFGLELGRPDVFWWYCILVVGVCVLSLRRLHGSSFGRSVFATRDDPVRADALGIPIARLRVALVVVAGFFAAVAGGLFAQQEGIVSPDSLFWGTSGNVLIMCLIGGIRHFWGPVLGAVVFVLLNTKLFQDLSYSNLYVGIVLLVVVLVFKGGLAGLPTQAAGLWRRTMGRDRSGA
jgi:branched-chain amino acid transport system permease protein